MKEEIYPLWSEEGMQYLASTDKLSLNGREKILALKEKFDDICTLLPRDDNDTYCIESATNINGAKYECIDSNKEEGWDKGDVMYRYFTDKEEEDACLSSGHWIKTEDSRLDNSVLKAMEVTSEKVNEVLPNQLHQSSIYEDDMHLLFFEVQVKKDENDNVKSIDLAPNPRLMDYLESFQTNAIIQAQVNTPNSQLRRDLNEKDVYATDINDYRNLGYTNNLVSNFREKGLDILGVEKKKDLDFEQNQEYLKLGTALANFAFEYAYNEGIVHKLHSDHNMIYNLYGKQETLQNNEEYNFKQDINKNKLLSNRFNRIANDYKNNAIALYTVDDKLVEQLKEQDLMKGLYKFDDRFVSYKSLNVSDTNIEAIKKLPKDIVHTTKDFNRKWELADNIGEIDKEIQKELNNMQNINFKYDEGSYNLIKALEDNGYKDKILKLMGKVDPESEEYQSSSFKKKESIDAKNGIYESSYDNYMKNFDTESFKLRGELQRTMRYYLTGRINGDMASINPQSDKFQRFLILPEKQLQGTFTENNQEDVMGVTKALSFSLGMKVENMTNREIIQGFNEKFSKLSGSKKDFVLMEDSKDGNEVNISLNKDWIGTEKFRNGPLSNVVKNVLDEKTGIGEVGSVFKNLSALYALSENMQNTKGSKEPQTYQSCFLYEIDGTNNGLAFKQSMMPLHVDDGILARCGILDKELYTGMHDYKGRDNGNGGVNADFYQSFAINFDKVCKEQNPEFLEAFQDFVGDDPLSKERRDFTKKVIMPAGYGGLTSPIRVFNEKLLDIYEDRQAKRAYELSQGLDDTDKTLKLLKEGFDESKKFLTLLGVDVNEDEGKIQASTLNMLCLGVTGGNRLEGNYDENKFYYVSFDEKDNIIGLKDYSKDVCNVLELDASRKAGVMGLVRDTTGVAKDLVTETLNVTFPKLVDLSKAEIELGQLQCKMYVDFLQDFNKAISAVNFDHENKKFKGETTELGGLNYEQGMLKIGKNVLPHTTIGDCVVPAVRPENTAIYDAKKVGQELRVYNNVKAKVKSGNHKVSRIVLNKALISSGAAACVFKIHPRDAMVARKTVNEMGGSILQVYDAMVVNHQQAPRVGQIYNKHFFNTVTKDNPIKEAVENFDKAVMFMDKVAREYRIPLSKDLQQKIQDYKNEKAAKYDYILDEKKRNKSFECVRKLTEFSKQIDENKEILYENKDRFICDQMAGGSLKVETKNELAARLKRIEVAFNKEGVKKDVEIVKDNVEIKPIVKTKRRKNEID